MSPAVTPKRPPVNVIFKNSVQSNITFLASLSLGIALSAAKAGHPRIVARLAGNGPRSTASFDRSPFTILRHAYVTKASRGAAPKITFWQTAFRATSGMITNYAGATDFGRFPIGSRLRILPNHACLTAAAHDRYYAIVGRFDGGVATGKRLVIIVDQFLFQQR